MTKPNLPCLSSARAEHLCRSTIAGIVVGTADGIIVDVVFRAEKFRPVEPEYIAPPETAAETTATVPTANPA